MGTQTTISQSDTELVICIRHWANWANWGWTCALAKGTGELWIIYKNLFPSATALKMGHGWFQFQHHIKVMEYHGQSSDVFLLVIKYLFHLHVDQFLTLMSFSGLLVDNQSVHEVKLGD